MSRTRSPKQSMNARRRPAKPGKAGGRAVKAMRQKGVSTNTKITVGLLIAVLAGLAALFIFVERDIGSQDAAERLVRPESHLLSQAAGEEGVTLVEFLDFECPGCAAVYPAIERLRQEYEGQITFVPRHFPLDIHPNAENAALAAEAASNQGKFAEMYAKLFETQAEWANAQGDQTATFERYADELGLDVARFRDDLADPDTARRVRNDQNDGVALGVSGTPTFFLNGERYDGPPTYDGLRTAIDKALAQ